MTEVILVDIFDNFIGVEEKLKAHMDKHLHRAFSLFVIDCNGNMLLQRRSKAKYHSPGLWANACCSHPLPDKDIIECVRERAHEELGIKIDVPSEMFNFVYYSEFNNGLTEYELDHVYIVNYTGDINFNPNEVDSVEWVNIDDLSKNLVSNPQKYCTWFLNCCPKVIEILNKKCNKL